MNIATKLALLTAAVTLAATFAIGRTTTNLARKTLTEHERVDLADETNLRMHELRERFREIGFLMRAIGGARAVRLVREATHEGQRPLTSAEFAAGTPLADTIDAQLRDQLVRSSEGAAVREVAFMNVGVDPKKAHLTPGHVIYARRCAPPADDPLKRPLPGPVVLDPPAGSLLANVDPAAVGTIETPIKPTQSQCICPVVPTPATDWPADSPRPLVMTLGYVLTAKDQETPLGLVLVTLDFTAFVERTARHAPRSLMVVTNRHGQILYHPDESRRPTPGHFFALKDEPADANGRSVAEFADAFDQSPEQDEVLRRVRGRTVPEVEFGPNGFLYAAQRVPPEFAAAHWEELNEHLERLAVEVPGLRYGLMHPRAVRLDVACRNRSDLVRVTAAIDRHEKELAAPGEALPHWRPAIACQRFAAHFVKVYDQFLGRDAGAEKHYFGLVMSSSLEEMQSDINEEVRGLQLLALLLGGAATAVALFFSVWLTRPLRQIRAATDRLAQGDRNAPLPLNRRDEIGELARAFDRMGHTITEREAEIKRMNEDLENRVRLRTTELQEAMEKLERALADAQAAVKAKDSFVARVSHELRNPLAIILGYNEALQEEVTDRNLDELLPDLQKIHASGSHLLGVVNDILDHAKIQAGELKLEVREQPVAPLVRDVVTLTQPLMAPNGNRLVVESPEDPGRMTTDGKRLKQVLINLLSNATKFTQKGTITLRVARDTGPDGDWLTFEVEDTGAGMTAEEMKGLFRPFYQVDGTHTRKAGGTGLGLTITKSLAEQMGGGVSVRSEKDKGSAFTVRLPASGPQVAPRLKAPTTNGEPSRTPPPATYRPKELPAELPALERNTVLVIDDDANVRELMERYLTKEGYSVRTAASGEDGLRLAKQIRPAAITLDVMMPGLDGWAMLAALKTDAHTHDIPVIMLTILDDRSRGYALGAADYLTKPVDWNRLGEIMRRFAAAPGSPVLLVDDDPNHRELIGRWLTKEGWPVTEAANGREALARLDAQRPGLVLLDLMMPEMDGFEFLEELRRREDLGRLPVVILTAKDLTPEDVARLNGCVAQILHKQALSQDELLRHVRQCVQRYTAAPAAAKE
jgi:signal transduction histidine kinase/DNA-binding response OmpR family regulator